MGLNQGHSETSAYQLSTGQGYPAQKAANPVTQSPFGEFQRQQLIIKMISKACLTFFISHNPTAPKHVVGSRFQKQ